MRATSPRSSQEDDLLGVARQAVVMDSAASGEDTDYESVGERSSESPCCCQCGAPALDVEGDFVGVECLCGECLCRSPRCHLLHLEEHVLKGTGA